MAKCSECSAHFPDPSQFCPKCGASAPKAAGGSAIPRAPVPRAIPITAPPPPRNSISVPPPPRLSPTTAESKSKLKTGRVAKRSGLKLYLVIGSTLLILGVGGGLYLAKIFGGLSLFDFDNKSAGNPVKSILPNVSADSVANNPSPMPPNVSADIVANNPSTIATPNAVSGQTVNEQLANMPISKEEATSFLYEYFYNMNSGLMETNAYVSKFYDNSVDYYGNKSSLYDILRDKNSFNKRWDERTVDVPQITSTNCDSISETCVLSGSYMFSFTRNSKPPEQTHSSRGNATFTIVVKLVNRVPKIISENARTFITSKS